MGSTSSLGVALISVEIHGLKKKKKTLAKTHLVPYYQRGVIE